VKVLVAELIFATAVNKIPEWDGDKKLQRKACFLAKS
jgi:hypothetical protein